MCGFVSDALQAVGLAPKAPKFVDPKIERDKAAAKAQQDANTALAFSRRARRDNSLFTGGGEAGGTTTTLGVGS